MNSRTTERHGAFFTISLIIAGIAVVVIYFAYPCHRYLSDGLKAAISLRDSTGWVVHPNHPLYPFLPQAIYRLIGGRESGLTELELLLLWSMGMGIIAAWGMIYAMRAAKLAVWTALIGLALFAFSMGVWYFSVIPGPGSSALGPQVVVLAAIALSLRKYPKSPNRTNAIIIGLLTAIAILFSQINAVLLLPAGYAMLLGESERREKFRNMYLLLGIAILVTLVAILLAGVTFGNVRSLGGLIAWQRSYVYDQRWWVGGIVDAVQRNVVGMCEVLVAYVFRHDGLIGNWSENFGTPYWYKRLGIRLGQAFLLLFFLVETIRAIVWWIRTRSLQPIQIIGVLSALPVILFTSVWTPETIHYRILYMPGFILFLAPWLEHVYELRRFRFRRAWLAVLAAAVLVTVNFTNFFYHQSKPEKNPDYWDIVVLDDYIGPGDLIIYSGSGRGGILARYAEYFLDCDVIRVHELVDELRSNPRAVWQDFERRHEAGHVLLIHEDALYSEADLREMNAAYGTNVRPGELLELLEPWIVMIEGGYAMAVEKVYYRFEPRDIPLPDL